MINWMDLRCEIGDRKDELVIFSIKSDMPEKTLTDGTTTLKPNTWHHLYIDLITGDTFFSSHLHKLDGAKRIGSYLTTKRTWWRFWRPVEWVGFHITENDWIIFDKPIEDKLSIPCEVAIVTKDFDLTKELEKMNDLCQEAKELTSKDKS